MKCQLFLFTILFVCSFTKVNSQSWEQAIDLNSSQGNGISLIESSEDKIIAIGNRFDGFGGDLQETLLFHFNKDGDVLLQDTFPNSECKKIVHTSDNKLLLIHTIEDVLNITYMDYDFNIIWDNEFPEVLGPPSDAIELPNNGGFLITGTVYDPASDCNVFLLKTTSDGTLDWFTNIPGDEYEVGRKIAVYNNEYIVGGFKRNNNTIEFTAGIWKLDTNGEFLGETIIDGTEGFLFYSMVFDDLGNLYCTGATSLSTTSETFVLKSNLDGNIEWLNTYNSDDNSMLPSNEFGNDILVNDSSELVILSSLFNKKQLILYKLSLDGTLVESKLFGEINETQRKEGKAIIQETNSDFYFIVGEQSQGDFFLAKVIFDLDVSTNELAFDSKISIRPNPTTDFIAIEGLASNLTPEFKLFDNQGNALPVSYVEKRKINVQILKSGIYYLSIYLNGKVKTLRFTKI